MPCLYHTQVALGSSVSKMKMLSYESGRSAWAAPCQGKFRENMQIKKMWIKNMHFTPKCWEVIYLWLHHSQVVPGSLVSKVILLNYESGNSAWAAPQRGKFLRQVWRWIRCESNSHTAWYPAQVTGGWMLLNFETSVPKNLIVSGFIVHSLQTIFFLHEMIKVHPIWETPLYE